jgi:hypothetical protein
MKTFKRILHSIWYGLEFEEGYTYKKEGTPSEQLMNRRNKYLLANGWERVTDVDENRNGLFMWYRKKR